MRIKIEDYFGNDVIVLQFCLRDNQVSNHQDRIDKINEIAIDYGYSVADIDEDGQGEYIRIQQIHVIDDDVDEGEQEAIDLTMLVSNLTADLM